MSQAHIETRALTSEFIELTEQDLAEDAVENSQFAQDSPKVLATSATANGRSFLERFFDSFFDEKNIRWLLIVGAAIVFGSSLMLVTREWSHWQAAAKYLTVLGYTAVGFTFAEVGRKRLGLKTTSKVLHLLTLLLMPLSFMSLSWLSAGTATQSALAAVEVLGLMIPATAFLWFASSRILDHLLNGRQTTFLINYQLLSIAGVIPDAASALPAFALMATLWMMFTVGVVKVNRHTFWLAEEHRLPRIFGFLPIAMLGLQFVTLVAVKCLSAISVQWIGLGCVLVAVTVLMTARTVADVFRKRTGDLVHPLPWNIAAPLFAGLVITAIGVFLSFRGFSYVGATTYAVIPTTAIAAVLMGLAARDTKHPGFVWASLICATIAYQCSPTLFVDIFAQLKQTAAHAINEQRLPVAFYGLTYLPLLAAVAMGSRAFAKRNEFTLSHPMKNFATFVAVVLFAAAVTHVKALFFVSLVNVAVFVAAGVLFRDRRYVVGSLLALVLATGSAIPCLNRMDVIDVDVRYSLTALAALAVAMTATGLVDRMLNRIPIVGARCSRIEALLWHAPGGGSASREFDSVAVREAEPPRSRFQGRVLERGELAAASVLVRADGTNRNLCQIAGWLLTALLAAGWVGSAMFHFGQPVQPFTVTQCGFLLIAFAMFTLRNPRYVAGSAFWMFLALAAATWFAGTGIAMVSMIAGASIIAAVASFCGYGLLKLTGAFADGRALQTLRVELGVPATAGEVEETSDGRERRVQAFVVPMCDLSLVVLSLLAVAFHLPNLVTANLEMNGLVTPVATAVSVLWLFAAGWCFRSRTAAAAGTIVLPLWATAVMPVLSSEVAFGWYPVVWATVAGVAKLLVRKVQTPNASVVDRIAEAWLMAVVGLSCLTFDWPARLAAAVALAVLFTFDRHELTASRRTWLAIAANFQALLLTAAIGGLNGFVPAALLTDLASLAIPLVFVASAVSVLLFDANRERFEPTASMAWTAILRAGMVVLAALSLSATGYSAIHIGLMIAGFVTMATAEFVDAIRQQKQSGVWLSFAAAGAAVAWLFVHGVIDFGAGVSQFVLLGTSVGALVAAKLCRRGQQQSAALRGGIRQNSSAIAADGGILANPTTVFAIAAKPFETVGMILPAIVALMCFGRELLDRPSLWLGWNSLAMFGSVAIYFHLAIVTRKKRFGLLTGMILNAALLLLWRTLNFNDLQWHLVPIGLSLLGFVELMKKELPRQTHDPLRYLGALTILVSPTFNLLGTSWLPHLSLMVFSVAVILVAIGLRLRALVYTGSAFLLADLVAMVVRSTIDNPGLLWIYGVAFGATVIALAAVCENHREKLLARIRMLSAELATWK